MADRLLLYGATGYTGRLIGRAAIQAGLRVVAAGRNEHKVGSIARELGVEFRLATLDDPPSLDRAMVDIGAVLNAAGPFRATAPALIQACLRNRVHYLDITGEAAVIDRASRSDRDAKQLGIMIMPAVGFDVVPSDCLALHAARRAVCPKRLFIGLSGLDLMTRGSAKTILLQMGDSVWVRRRGLLDRVPPGTVTREFDYGAGHRASIAVTWGDVVTAYFSTGIPDITVYSEATPPVRTYHAFLKFFGGFTAFAPWREMLGASTEWMPEGPSETERKLRHTVIVAEVEDADGRIIRSRMRTPDAYSMTAATAAAAASKVLAGDFEAGFHTPARIYGADFPLRLSGVIREDL
jgi:short subunit dehydrogenase-like uncharacterized protein